MTGLDALERMGLLDERAGEPSGQVATGDVSQAGQMTGGPVDGQLAGAAGGTQNPSRSRRQALTLGCQWSTSRRRS